MGLTTIATAVGEEAGTIEEVHEPFLMEGFIQRTPRGRVADSAAYQPFENSIYVTTRQFILDQML